MKFDFASRSRAGILLVALALVGGTGCITSAVMSQAQHRKVMLELEDRRQQRIKALEPLADAGNTDAQVFLAVNLMASYTPEKSYLPRALRLLSDAAEHQNATAQALLGDMIGAGQSKFGERTALPREMRDPARALFLLQQAATKVCQITLYSGEYNNVYFVLPALRVSELLMQAHQPTQARLWEARRTAHCTGVPSNEKLYGTEQKATPQQRIDSLAWHLLDARDQPRMRDLKEHMTPDDIASAERQAAELRTLVAASERQFPAPPFSQCRGSALANEDPVRLRLNCAAQAESRKPPPTRQEAR